MTLPLNPMSTAPRDGREVLFVLDPTMNTSADGNHDKVIAYSSGLPDEWINGPFRYTDRHFSGWLDIPGMARDSARLDKLEVMIRERKGSFLWRNTSPPYRDMVTMRHGHFKTIRDAVDAVRAAIDKEAECDR